MSKIEVNNIYKILSRTIVDNAMVIGLKKNNSLHNIWACRQQSIVLI